MQDLCSTGRTQEHVQEHADYTAPTRHHDLDHTDHTDHTHQYTPVHTSTHQYTPVKYLPGNVDDVFDVSHFLLLVVGEL